MSCQEEPGGARDKRLIISFDLHGQTKIELSLLEQASPEGKINTVR